MFKHEWCLRSGLEMILGLVTVLGYWYMYVVELLGESAVSRILPVVNVKGIERLVQEVMGNGP